VQAATFVVTNTNDAGPGSLRAAIAAANTNPGPDTVSFASQAAGVIELTSGSLNITEQVQILGPGPDVLRIDGGNQWPILVAESNGLSVAGLKLTNSGGDGIAALVKNRDVAEPSSLVEVKNCVVDGNTGSGVSLWTYAANSNYRAAAKLVVDKATITGNGSHGISLRSTGPYDGFSLDVRDTVLSGNLGNGVDGWGGDYSGDETLDIENSEITKNTNGIRIGTWFSTSRLTVRNTDISENTGSGISAEIISAEDSLIADNGGDGASGNSIDCLRSIVTGNTGTGLGVYGLDYDAARVSGDSCTISANAGSGVAITSILASGVDLTLKNSTVSDNESNGIDTFSVNETIASIENSTITGNAHSGGVGGVIIYGFESHYRPHSATFRNSIIADSGRNLPDLVSPGPNSARFTVDYSLIEKPGGVDITETTPGSNIFGRDPVLGPLQDNGGPTPTHALLAGSPAIDAGDPDFEPPPAFDQRGGGFHRVAGGRVDMGAFEVQGESDSLFVRALGDINGDGNQDIVALYRQDGNLVATVKDAETPRWIKQIRFDSSLVAVDLEVMPDINRNGAPELVVLGRGSTRSEVRDSLTGQTLGSVEFDPALAPVDLELVTDRTGNGIPELAMLGQGSMEVEIKDPVSNAWVKRMFFNDYVPIDLSVWNRGNRVSVGVLAESKDPAQSDKVEIRDLASGQIVKHLWVSRPFDLLQMELVSDLNGNGAPELAILREHPVDNWVSVQAMDTASGYRFQWLGFDPQYRPVRFRVLDDLNGNGSQEVAVLAVRRGCCNQKVWVKDPLTGQSIRQVFFGKQFIGEDMDIVPDINGNGTPELVVLGRRDDGKLAAIIKDSKTGEFVSWVGFW
jgi:hypothetical protein